MSGTEYLAIKFTGDASDAVTAARQVRAALVDVENEAQDASRKLAGAADVHVAASGKQVKAQRELLEQYQRLAKNAKDGSDEQLAANRLAGQSARKLGLDLTDTEQRSSRLATVSNHAGAGLRAMGQAATVAGLALAGGLALGAKAAFGELQASAKVSAQTAAALKSTGSAAHVTAKQVAERLTVSAQKAGRCMDWRDLANPPATGGIPTSLALNPRKPLSSAVLRR